MDCLVIIDMQNGFVSEENKNLAGKIARLAKRKSYDFIVATQFCNTTDSPYVSKMGWYGLMNEESQKLVPEIEKLAPKVVMKKTGYSCFTDEFKEFVRANFIDSLTFVGMDTEGCVMVSALDAFKENMNLQVLTRYCESSGGEEYHNAGVLVMKRLLGSRLVV